MGLLAAPATGVWESQHGSDDRPGHCDPVPDPSWRPPGLAWVLTKDGDHPSGVEGVWVLPTNGMETTTERILVTVDGTDGWLHHHSTTFEELLEQRLYKVWPFVELIDVEGNDTPELVIGAGVRRAMFDIYGSLIREYVPEPLPPGLDTGRAYMWPAVGDFTNDGQVEVVFPGDEEWHGFRSGGEFIARHVYVDERDTAGWLSVASHLENGRDYLYITTANEGGTETTIQSRLHKLTLEPNPLYNPAMVRHLPTAALPVGTDLPYVFSTVWMKEFPGDAVDDQLRFYDLTGDGVDEIIIGHSWRPASDLGMYSILDLDGNILFSHPFPKTSWFAVGDTLGNGVPEVIAIGTRPGWDQPFVAYPESFISSVEWNGNGFFENYQFQVSDEYGGRFLAVCDVDGDGRDEILVALGEATTTRDKEAGNPVGDGIALLVNAEGERLWEYRFFFGMPWRGVIIDDFTGDGSYEFILPTNAGQVLVFSPSVEPSPADYEQMFEGLLNRPYRMPTEAQVRGWMSEVGGTWPPASDASTPPGDVPPSGIGREGDAGSTAVVIFVVTLAVVVLARRRL